MVVIVMHKDFRNIVHEQSSFSIHLDLSWLHRSLVKKYMLVSLVCRTIWRWLIEGRRVFGCSSEGNIKMNLGEGIWFESGVMTHSAYSGC